jgi:hypothetical protein
MNNFIDNDGAPGQSGAAGPARAEIDAKGAARRRFTRTGAGAAGVIMTLVSQPGMADVVCAAPSAVGSTTHKSHAPASESNCGLGGWSPGYWKQWDIHRWPAPYKPVAKGGKPATLFSDVFTMGSYCANLKGKTLLDVLTPQICKHGDGQNLIAYYMVSTLLSAASGKIKFLKTTDVTAIWNEYIGGLTFTPNAGATPWGPADLLFYLKSITEK